MEQNVRCGRCGSTFSAQLPPPPTAPPAVPAQWECRACTLLNASSVAACAACGEPRRSVSTSTPSPATRQQSRVDGGVPFVACPCCTLSNKIDASNCEACGARLDDRCPKCTLSNAADAVICAACGEVLGPGARRHPSGQAPGLTSTNTAARGAREAEQAGGRARSSVPAGAPPVGRQRSVGETSEPIEARRAKHEAEAAAIHSHILEFCAASNEPFVDDAFPPSPKSIYLDGRAWAAGSSSAHRSASLGSLSWLRPSEIAFPDARVRPRELVGGLLGAMLGGRTGSGAGTNIASSTRGRYTIIDDAPSADDIRQQVRDDGWPFAFALALTIALALALTVALAPAPT